MKKKTFIVMGTVVLLLSHVQVSIWVHIRVHVIVRFQWKTSSSFFIMKTFQLHQIVPPRARGQTGAKAGNEKSDNSVFLGRRGFRGRPKRWGLSDSGVRAARTAGPAGALFQDTQPHMQMLPINSTTAIWLMCFSCYIPLH